MKVLSLLQPWASWVITGRKTIETRRWQTDYRGQLLIHAGASTKGFTAASDNNLSQYEDINALPCGAIIGCVLLTGIIRLDRLQISDESLASQTMEGSIFGGPSHGRYAWLFQDAVQFKTPIPAKGHLHLWNMPDAVVAKYL